MRLPHRRHRAADVNGERRDDGMVDRLDVSLQDDELFAEIRLATKLMIAASERDRCLTAVEVDRLLGVHGVDVSDPDVRLPAQRDLSAGEAARPDH
jgi:hypothetical protein